MMTSGGQQSRRRGTRDHRENMKLQSVVSKGRQLRTIEQVRDVPSREIAVLEILHEDHATRGGRGEEEDGDGYEGERRCSSRAHDAKNRRRCGREVSERERSTSFRSRTTRSYEEMSASIRKVIGFFRLWRPRT